jgi:hypothetical protein
LILGQNLQIERFLNEVAAQFYNLNIARKADSNIQSYGTLKDWWSLNENCTLLPVSEKLVLPDPVVMEDI